jgi:hypothetical protein
MKQILGWAEHSFMPSVRNRAISQAIGRIGYFMAGDDYGRPTQLPWAVAFTTQTPHASDPERVLVHDFVDPALGRAIPYGVYDVGRNLGWVSVGIDHDTASFAVESIRRWWERMGQPRYPKAARLLVTADAGGSNSPRIRLWRVELQHLADELRLPITVCHFPPGTSKWNKIEHRLFSFISMNWRGKPLLTYQVIVSLIAATTTRAGLRVEAAVDRNKYPAGVKVPDAELQHVNLKPARFHGEWNYTVAPHPSS